MLTDLMRTSEAVLLFSLVLLAPGYVIGWALDLLKFRRRLPLTRLAIAVPVSIGICPTVTYYAWRFFPAALPLFYGGCAAGLVLLVFRERRACLRLQGGFPYSAVVAGWVAIAILIVVDMQIGHRLYFPTVTYDYALRTAFTSAISRTGVPPHNPYFFPGQFFPLRYHYFWLLLCSLVQKIAGPAVSPRQAMLAGTAWCGIGLLAIVPLYLRFFVSGGKADIGRRARIGAALLMVTGLDLCPALLFGWFATRGFFADVEWWNVDQISAWVTAVAWVPHHVAGLIACLMGFLLLWDAARLPHQRERVLAVLTAGFMFASAVGLSIFVTFVFAAFLAVWTGIELLRGHCGAAGLICVSGITALLLGMPHLLQLLSGQPGASGTATVPGGLPLQLAVRHLAIADFSMGLEGGGWRQNLVSLAMLPVNYFLELGFFLIIGIIRCKVMWRTRRNLAEDQLCGFTMAITSVGICTFVRSTVIGFDDLGVRGFLVAQFILLIWGTEMVNRGLLSRGVSPWSGGRPNRAFVIGMLVLGVAGSLYEAMEIRFYPLQSDLGLAALHRGFSADRKLGARTYALRQLYEELKRRTSPDAVFQHNPDTDPQDNYHGLYADRQLAAENSSCAVVFGGDSGLCRDRIREIRALFDNPKSFDSTQIDAACRQLSIDVLVVQPTDHVWQDSGSWVWQRGPMAANDYARAFACGRPPVMLTGAR